MKSSTPWWQNPVVYRTAIGVYVLLVLGLAGASFAVSNHDVRGGIYVRGHAEMETGRTNGLRGVFHYAPTGETLHPGEMEWTLLPQHSDNSAVPLSFGDATALELWPDLPVQLPDSLAEGDYLLQARTSHDKIPEMITEVPVTVAPRPEAIASLQERAWPELSLRDDETHRRRPRVESLSTSPSSALAITPPDGELVRGLSERVFFRVFDEETGSPLPATLSFEVLRGVQEGEMEPQAHTDDLGFAYINVTPATDLELLVSVVTLESTLEEPDELDGPAQEESGPDQFTVRISAVASQFGTRPHSRVVTPDDPIEATIFSILGDCTYMVDLYDDGDRLLETLTLAMRDGRGGARFQTPSTSEASPLLRIQAYQSLYGTTHGWDSAHLLLLEDDSRESLLEATRELFTWIAEHTDSSHHRALVEEGYLDEELTERQLRRLIEAGLDELPRAFELPPILMNSRQGDREALEVWKTEVRSDLQILMGIVLLGGVMVVFYLVALGIRRYRREALLLAEVDLEFDGDDDPEALKAIQLERVTVALQGAIVLITILAFALGILLVVSYL